MKFGYVKVCAVSPEIKVADTVFNADSIIKSFNTAYNYGAEVVVFPELCIAGYTAGDLFYSDILLSGASDALEKIRENSLNKKALIFVGMPLRANGLLYDVSAVVNDGKILAFIPKQNLLDYGEYNEKRYFAVAPDTISLIDFNGQKIPFGNKIVFKENCTVDFTVSAEIGNDIYSVCPPSLFHVRAGANLIVNLCASTEIVGRKEYRELIVKSHSAKTVCAYALAEAGEGESTTDSVFGGHNLIAENGKILAQNKPFEFTPVCTEVDLSFVANQRLKAFNGEKIYSDGYQVIGFDGQRNGEELTRVYEKTPFVPEDEKSLLERAEQILDIQAEGLKKRIKHARASSAVLGLSGGLDSTLAILVAVRAMAKLNRSAKDVIAVTMPCFGTTSRTFTNTVKLSKALGVTLKKVDIGKAVTVHLKDIKHEDGVFDVTYENAQARERTQVLMDIANMNNGMVIGTGDLSELALGWATYNGDHMSMYAVNASVPKTLVRHVVEFYANRSKGKLKAVLEDILDTPVSPELLPADNDDIKQKTEDIVGPYVLHDFFLYNLIKRGFNPDKVYFIAKRTFKGLFDDQTILKWLKTFVRRFFIQQFKRSCVPDGVKVGSLSLSPRGDWKMPSDAVSSLWLNSLENLE